MLVITNGYGGVMKTNLDLYKVFYYVAKNKSITQAANELMVSQPAVSKSIKIPSLVAKVNREVDISNQLYNIFYWMNNDTYDERNAKVTIKAGATTQSFVVTQKQKDGLTVTSNKVEVSAEGGDIAIEVKANVDFKVEISVDWIVQNTKSRGLESKPLSFTVAENTTDEAREGLITISSGELKQEIKVIQAPKVVSEPDSEEGKGTGAEIEPGGGIEEE